MPQGNYGLAQFRRYFVTWHINLHRIFSRTSRIDVVYGHRIIIDEQNQEIGRWVLPPHDNTMLLWADYVPQEHSSGGDASGRKREGM